MIPSAELRLSSMIRAVEDVILPAVAGHSGLAEEQAHILLGQLHLLRMQVDHVPAYERVEARSLGALARDLVQQADGGDATASSAGALEELLSGSDPVSPADVRAFTTAVSVAVEELLLASGRDGTDAFKASSTETVIRHGREQSMRDRSWFALTGFEGADVVLTPFDELVETLDRDGAATG